MTFLKKIWYWWSCICSHDPRIFHFKYRNGSYSDWVDVPCCFICYCYIPYSLFNRQKKININIFLMERHYLTCTKMFYKMIKKYIKLISFHFAINYTLKSIYIFLYYMIPLAKVFIYSKILNLQGFINVIKYFIK